MQLHHNNHLSGKKIERQRRIIVVRHSTIYVRVLAAGCWLTW